MSLRTFFEQTGGLLSSAALFALMAGSVIYAMYFTGDPEVKAFRENCHRHYAAKFRPGDVPDAMEIPIISTCEKELRQFLDDRRARKAGQ